MELKRELVLPNDDLPFRMFVFEGKNGHYRVSKHWHDSVEIFLVFEGEIEFFINSADFNLKAGEFILVNPNDVHSIEAPRENFTVVLQIPPGAFDSYKEEEYIHFARQKSQKPEEEKELVRLIKLMYTAYAEKQFGYELQVLGYYYSLLHLLVTSYRVEEPDEEKRRLNRQMHKLHQITAYIQEHYMEDITLEGIAELFSFSPTYLSRIFRKYANVNYKTYVLNVRVEYAFKELLNTDQSINKIAESCGFPDGRSFAKAFQKRFGISPDKYRRAIRKRQESATK